MSFKQICTQNTKKKPPPRPPPPNFTKFKSKSTYSLHQQSENLIDWSPPSSPKTNKTHNFGGSVSSSFSSSTSSLASSKKSFELDSGVTNNIWPINTATQNDSMMFPLKTNQVSYMSKPQQTQQSCDVIGTPSVPLKSHLTVVNNSNQPKSGNAILLPSVFGPTIIRAQVPSKKPPKSQSTDEPLPTLPMPKVPPPSPPKEVADIDIPYGIALYDYPATDKQDLPLQAGDVVILSKRINNEWLYGQVIDREGIFPACFIDIKVPLKEDQYTATAIYDFFPQMEGDLKLTVGQTVRVTKKISEDWLYGECEGRSGQFPKNYVDRIPPNL